MSGRHAAIFACLLELLTMLAPHAAFADAAVAVKSASDATCAARSDLALSRSPVRVMRVIGDPTTTPSDWRPADPISLEVAARDPDVFTEVADVWRVDGRIAIVNIESRSLEYREETSYCFRENGSLVRLQSTSSGMTNIDDETRYFDASGRVVATSSKLALLYPRPGETISPDLKASKPDVFLRVEALPFFVMIAP